MTSRNDETDELKKRPTTRRSLETQHRLYDARIVLTGLFVVLPDTVNENMDYDETMNNYISTGV